MAHFAEARADAAIDALAAAGDPAFGFLRARWFGAANLSAARDETGRVLAGFGLVERRKGLLRISEIAGGYWPFRSIPIDEAATAHQLARALLSLRSDLGPVWRLGPVAANDPALSKLLEAAGAAGWRPLVRRLGTLFELDLPAEGEWPSAKTQRKNRWRKRRLEEIGGESRVEFFTGADWTPTQRDATAAIERASWLAKLPGGGDTKFRDPEMRTYWESLCADPVLAHMIFGSILWIGDTPAAFTFGIAAGPVRYYIANNFDERFTQFGPGRVLLYDDFARARELGTTVISWGLGDGGYKSEMGARPGPELHDILFVRGRLLPLLAKRLWER